MSIDIKRRAEELGIILPKVSAPVANYVPFMNSGNLLWISGQLPVENGLQFVGKLGDNITTEQGYKSARLAGMNALSQLTVALEKYGKSLDKVIMLRGFVNSTPDFTEHPQVINGASDLLVEVLGHEFGDHARAAVGVASLPLGVSTEVELTVAVR